MDADAILAADRRARAHFTYVPDPPGRDTWRSHAADVDGPWSGDCDDLTSTALHLLADAGAPLDRLYRLEVSTTRNGVVNHLVGFAWDDHGGGWIVGDTRGQAYPAANCDYEPIEYQRLDDVETVRIGAPWS